MKKKKEQEEENTPFVPSNAFFGETKLKTKKYKYIFRYIYL